MTHINFNNPGGMPLTQKVLEKMQETYESMLPPICRALGDAVFLSGCVVNGNLISDGWLTMNGELLPFVGGVVKACIDVQEETITALYNDGGQKQLYTIRKAVLSPAGVPFEEFVHIKSLASFRTLPVRHGSDYSKSDADILATIKAVFDLKQELKNQFPAGIISMWAGEISAIPSGWALCDGQEGRPDLRDRFIVGAGNEYNIGSTGGEKTHKLTAGELPQINALGGTNFTSVPEGGGGYIKKSVSGQSTTPSGHDATGSGNEANTTTVFPFPALGNGEAHENRPPYFALAYIIKL